VPDLYFKEIPMKCWICGKEGTRGAPLTREHLTKASDLKDLCGNVTQKHPIFLHTAQQRNIKIGSIKSDKLKSDAIICSHCNNARTAANDRAWESLSKFLRERRPFIKKGDLVRLDKVFPGSVSRSMLNVHLYFVKLFGCAIVENGLLIDIAPFAEAIMRQQSHPNVYIAFGPTLNNMEIASRTDIDTANVNGKCVFAIWFYIVNPILVSIIYAEPNEQKRRQGLVHAWHPSTVSKRLHIGAF
jgi:hypothetical protein